MRISTSRRSRSTPATRRPSRGTPSGRVRSGSASRCSRSPTPAAGACARRSGRSARPGARSAGPRGRRIGGSLEHTAPLPRGSSGGPLVDGEHRLLGLNSIRLEGGLILALPADAAMQRRAEALAAGKATERPRLGIALAPARAARGCVPLSGCRSGTACWCAGSWRTAPRRRRAWSGAICSWASTEQPLSSVDELFDALEAGGETLARRAARDGGADGAMSTSVVEVLS